MSIYRRLIADRPAFEQFYVEARARVNAIAEGTETDLSVIRRQVHTLKGNCALFGLESVAGLCHEIEDRINDAAALGAADRARLKAAWAATEETHAALTNAGADASLRVTRDDYQRLRSALLRMGAPAALRAEIEAWEFELVDKRFALVRDQIQQLAQRLGKAEVDVVWQATTLRLPPRRWAPFWSAFAHVIRNTVDHGVETNAERLAAGKSARATIRLGIGHDDGQVLVCIEDDGPGVNWGAIAEKARARGLPCGDRQALEEALFADGMSSKAASSETSGRGVGLGAVRATLHELGGRLELTDNRGSGTSLRCWLPDSMLAADRSDETADDDAPPTMGGVPAPARSRPALLD